MDVTLQNAAMAYGKAINRGGEAGPESAPAAAGDTSFADMLKNAGEQAATTIEQSEKVGVMSNLDKVELTDVVQAVNNAEVALQTVVAVRDRVVEAYQQIIRMPI